MSILRNLERKRETIYFTSNMIKIFAMLSMLIDHIGLMLILNGKLYGYDATLYNNVIKLPTATRYLIIYRVFRVFGRISFPLFAFLLVESFRKSSNVFKYSVRLFLLAMMSEVPFDLMVFNKVYCFDKQNVVFLYLIAVIMLVIIRQVEKFSKIIVILFMPIFSAIAYMLKVDYAVEGIVLIFIFYIFRSDLDAKCIFALIVCLIYSFKNNFGAAALAIPIIYFYKGNKGILDLKKFSYIFYPLHMILLYAIEYIIYLH